MSKEKNKNIGLSIKSSTKECTDKKCPFHGSVNVKPEFLVGRIIRKDTHNSATMEWERRLPVPKYERVEKRRSTIRIHNPPCVNAQVDDRVTVARTRPLSKTKNYVIVKIEEVKQ